MRKSTVERELIRDFLVDTMAASLLGNMPHENNHSIYNDAVQAEASHFDLRLIKRARKVLGLRPLRLKIPSGKWDWYYRSGEIARAWAEGKSIKLDGEIR